jgi:hypothetical protein
VVTSPGDIHGSDTSAGSGFGESRRAPLLATALA